MAEQFVKVKEAKLTLLNKEMSQGIIFNQTNTSCDKFISFVTNSGDDSSFFFFLEWVMTYSCFVFLSFFF